MAGNKYQRSYNSNVIPFIQIRTNHCCQNNCLWISKFSNIKQELILHPFKGLFSRTTWVIWYQKGKTSLDLNEERGGAVLKCKQSGTLFTIGRTTVFWRTPVVRPPYDMRGYSRCTSYVRRPCAGRKFGRKSTTPTEMSYDLLSYAYYFDIFIFTFLVVSCCLHGSYVILHVTAGM